MHISLNTGPKFLSAIVMLAVSVGSSGFDCSLIWAFSPPPTPLHEMLEMLDTLKNLLMPKNEG